MNRHGRVGGSDFTDAAQCPLKAASEQSGGSLFWDAWAPASSVVHDTMRVVPSACPGLDPGSFQRTLESTCPRDWLGGGAAIPSSPSTGEDLGEGDCIHSSARFTFRLAFLGCTRSSFTSTSVIDHIWAAQLRKPQLL